MINTYSLPKGFVDIDIFESLKMAFARMPKIVMRPNRVMPTGPDAVSTQEKNKSRVFESLHDKKKRIRRELVDAGVTVYGLIKAESRYLPKVLHDGEKIESVIYGQHHSSSVMIVATNERIIVLDKKPMAVRCDEVSYEVVSGIGIKIGFIFAEVILHTAITNFDMKWVNMRCAEKFVKHIEAERLKRELAEETIKEETRELEEVLAKEKQPKKYIELMDNLSGYYLLPVDEEERKQVLNEIP